MPYPEDLNTPYRRYSNVFYSGRFKPGPTPRHPQYRHKMVYKGDNVVGALLNVPIFVGTFSIVTEFAILEDMDAYRDEGMGDVIVGEPFLKESWN
ncbi:hypothetical protein Tco_0488005 [Tanacetum coccineum]